MSCLLFAALTGGRAFSKLDLPQAYQQLVLDEASKFYKTISTRRGLYRYNRLPFGVSAAPAIFQRTLETLLCGIPNVCVYLDDTLVTGKTSKEHLKNLGEVLTRLETAGMRLKEQKCGFLLPEIKYLGHRITSEGQLPTCMHQGESNNRSTCTYKHIRAQSFLRIGQLLW